MGMWAYECMSVREKAETDRQTEKESVRTGVRVSAKAFVSLATTNSFIRLTQQNMDRTKNVSSEVIERRTDGDAWEAGDRDSADGTGDVTDWF